jgi:phage tail protein X
MAMPAPKASSPPAAIAGPEATLPNRRVADLMAVTAIAQQDDMLDAICWRTLGTTAGGVVEQALDLNPGLSETALIAAGTPVLLPDPPTGDPVSTLDTTNLWD